MMTILTLCQARLALLGACLLDQVPGAIAALSNPTREASAFEWNFRPRVRRDSLLVASIAGLLGLTDAQVDALFIEAATL